MFKSSDSKFKFSVGFLVPIEAEIEEAFLAVLEDYCAKRGADVVDSKREYRIIITGAEGGFGKSFGICVMSTIGLMIQVQDPFLDGDSIHEMTLTQFFEALAHEMVHACQFLTDCNGMEVAYNYDKNDEQDSYFFEESEVEARVLEAYYSTKIIQPLLEAAFSTAQEAEVKV